MFLGLIFKTISCLNIVEHRIVPGFFWKELEQLIGSQLIFVVKIPEVSP